MGRRLPAAVIGLAGIAAGAGSGVAASTGAATSQPEPPPPSSTPAPPTPFVHPAGVHDPNCVIEIQPGDSLSLIADAMPDTAVTYTDLQQENGVENADHIEVGDYLDICVGNRLDDVTGEPREQDTGEILDPSVAAQQRKLNELFTGYGIPELVVDGISGPLTRRHLCAARVAFGWPASRDDMAPGSSEEQLLMATTALPRQPDAPDRWIVIDKTCQVMFVGGGEDIVFVFPTSTGSAGYETRDQQGARAFRFDPAVDNDGWHDSTVYPVDADNPLNGNMYMPIYFDNGQAIHGSYNVPPEPLSKGCARLLVEDHDTLLAWLGLAGETRPIWSSSQIDLVVNVQGQFVPTAEPAE